MLRSGSDWIYFTKWVAPNIRWYMKYSKIIIMKRSVFYLFLMTITTYDEKFIVYNKKHH
jgi:hypothetical protein